jgi:hypothetical protein
MARHRGDPASIAVASSFGFPPSVAAMAAYLAGTVWALINSALASWCPHIAEGQSLILQQSRKCGMQVILIAGGYRMLDVV